VCVGGLCDAPSHIMHILQTMLHYEHKVAELTDHIQERDAEINSLGVQ